MPFSTPVCFAHSRMAFEVNSVPLSLTMSFGLPCLATSVVSSRATRLPEIDVLIAG